MSRNTVLFGLLLSMAFSLVSRTETVPRLSGPYLGQKPPGLVPEIFAPGIISSGESEGCSGWGKNMEYFIFQRWENRKPRLYIMHQENGTWGAPGHLPFADAYQVGDFTIAPDGLTMAFASNIMIEGIGSAGEGGNIWFVKKNGHDWSQPYPLKPPVNTKYHDSYPSLAANGNIYFFSRRPGGCGQSDLYMSKFLNGAYQEPLNLGAVLNSEYHEWDSYIAPDESYMIYCSMMPGGLGEDDLYIAFRQIDGSWGKPMHMGSGINSDQSENRPYVSPDGKYLFFTSSKKGNRDIYWVDAAIIEEFNICNSLKVRGHWRIVSITDN